MGTESHAAEDRERAGEREEPSAPGRDDGEGDGDERRLEGDEDDVAEPRELERPDAADRELAEADDGEDEAGDAVQPADALDRVQRGEQVDRPVAEQDGAQPGRRPR